jgi:CheY-like chemotaxis protein
VLKNAVKFTPSGGKISVSTRTSGDGKRVEIEISDTGIGMTPAEISRVFDAFTQGEHAAQGHRFGGLGLGLTISRMLTEMHGGTIRASSAGPEQGSVFVIEFPLHHEVVRARKESDVPSGYSRPPLGGVARAKKATVGRILLVEDHEPTRVTLTRLLTRRRWEVLTAATVAEARALASNQVFNLLISDIGLPDGNGYDLMVELRERHGLKGIALSGYGMEEDLARSRQAGFLAHLTKPLSVESLDAALAAVAASAKS